MKLRAFSLCVFACTACAFEIDDFLDRLDTALTISAFQDNLRARLSGTLDLEIYHFEQPAPGLIDSNIDTLFNPRLTLFLDTQIGSQIYFFAHSQLHRGFEPRNLASSPPSSAIGFRGTCRGTTRLSTRPWFTKMSPLFRTNTLRIRRSISSTD